MLYSRPASTYLHQGEAILHNLAHMWHAMPVKIDDMWTFKDARMLPCKGNWFWDHFIPGQAVDKDLGSPAAQYCAALGGQCYCESRFYVALHTRRTFLWAQLMHILQTRRFACQQVVLQEWYFLQAKASKVY